MSTKKCLRVAGLENLYDAPEPYVTAGPITAIPRKEGTWVVTADPGVRWRGEYGPADRESWRRAFRRMSPVDYTVLLIGGVSAAVAAVYVVLQMFSADLITVGAQAVVLLGAFLAMWAGVSTAHGAALSRARLTRAGVDDVADTISRGRRNPVVSAREAAAVVMMYREGHAERALMLVDALEAPSYLHTAEEESAARRYASADVEAWWEYVDRRERAAADAREAAARRAREAEELVWVERLAERGQQPED